MKRWILAALAGLLLTSGASAGEHTPILPRGVTAVWDVEKAFREKTATHERICINGLWRWQPGRNGAEAVPEGEWGYFKVPGSWPGITDYMQKDSQTVYPHPNWRTENIGQIKKAWYQREIAIPAEWKGRSIVLSAEYLNSFARVYVDGKKAGEIRFPGGDVDLSSVCRPGGKHVLSMLVIAMPLKEVMLSYNDTASANEVQGSVARRGLCGDVYLLGMPARERIAGLKVDTSVRRGEITFNAELIGLAAGENYVLRARIMEEGHKVGEFASKAFKMSDLRDGRFAFTEKWIAKKLWDIHTPENSYDLHLSLTDSRGNLLDAGHEVRFGFREFWIDKRDFFLNGSRIFLSSVPLDNAQVGAGLANYQAAKESLLRLKSFGINFVYTHNYGCLPGSHLGFEEILKAADDVGMLVSLSQPHFGHYEWQASDADRNNGYARHAEFYARAAGSHPSVVMYSMSHNATGYSDDMNPDMIDGIRDYRDTWSLKNSRLALRAEAVVKRLDPSRIVYHHSSGNLGSMHTSNFYPNFAPIQELSDWFEHWATKGVKPLFTCEYAAPSTWDWTMYRGWYRGKRAFGSAKVPWEFCLAEWNSQFFGDRAFQISEKQKVNLRWEAGQFRAGNLWKRWDYPYHLDSRELEERYPIFDMYFTDNWRAFRTWGVSANSPWEHSHFWKQRDGVDKGRKEIKVNWENLQRPGFSPDYVEGRYERMDMAFARSDWIPTAAAQALIRNNRPFLAYIAGKPGKFTSKDHNFQPGETIEKQLIIINNSRRQVDCECRWNLDLPAPVRGRHNVLIETGQQARIPLRIALPPGLKPGEYRLTASVKFSSGEVQDDSLAIHVLQPPPPPQVKSGIALFDPKGETTKLLGAMGIPFEAVGAAADLTPYKILIVGKEALTLEGPAPSIARVREGLKVLMLEQKSEVLEKRFGFRVQEYGLRQIFKRIPDHPILSGLVEENLRDWRGEATIVPPRLNYKMRPGFGPTVEWCGIQVTRAWRCGNYGNVATVLIEKPARGDFLPIVDGGFNLQYSPLMEYREAKGMVLICQLDVTGRTESDPAAMRLVSNMLTYISDWKPQGRREAVYVGDPAGRKYLEEAGVALAGNNFGRLHTGQVLIAGPGAGQKLESQGKEIKAWLQTGGKLMAIGLEEREAQTILSRVRMKKTEHINSFFGPPAFSSAFAGIGPADVTLRGPVQVPLVTAGSEVMGSGVLAFEKDFQVILCQLVPWQFEYKKSFNLKRSYRRTAFMLNRVLANLGVAGKTPFLSRFSTPLGFKAADLRGRWLEGFYLDTPEEWDDPYRFFRW